jgi:hypothetical protein
VKQKIFIFPKISILSPFSVLGDLSPGVKQARHEADHTPPPGAEVKNACSYASMPTHAYTRYTGTTSFLNFTLFLFLSHNLFRFSIFEAEIPNM